MKKQQCGYASGEELFVAVFGGFMSGSTRRFNRQYSGLKPTQQLKVNRLKTTQQLKVSSDRLGEPAIELGSTGYKARDISTAPRRLALRSA